jgi:hypothetical protein
MIVFTMDAVTKAAVVAALEAHGADTLTLVGLGRVRAEDSALATGAVMSVWPADDDGKFRIALTDTAGVIAWRAYMAAEIAADRGKRMHLGRYGDALGVDFRTDYKYVAEAVKGTGLRPVSGASWSDGTMWVACDGDVADPRKRWARSAWRGRATAHEKLAEVGLAVRGQPTWKPLATCLFDAPMAVTPSPVLAPADDAAIAELA